jgi:hypothetical protein
MSSDVSGIPSGPALSPATAAGRPSEEVFLELASLAEQSIEKRQDIEWKVSVAFWAGIAVFTWLAIRELGRWPGIWCWLLVGLYVLVFLVWTFCWLMPMHSAGRIEGEWKRYYMDRALGLTRPEPASPSPGTTCFGRLWSYWATTRSQPRFWGEAGLAAFFLLLSLLVIHGADLSQQHFPGPQDNILHLSGRSAEAVIQKLAR